MRRKIKGQNGKLVVILSISLMVLCIIIILASGSLIKNIWSQKLGVVSEEKKEALEKGEKGRKEKEVLESKPITYEEVAEQMKKEDIEKFGPQVPFLIERIREKMKNKTLCPPDREDMDILYLGRSRDPRAVSILIEVMRDYEGKSARVQAIRALEMINDRTVIPALEEALKDKEEKVRLFAAFTLTGFNEKSKPLPILIEALKSNLSSGFKQTALDGLTKIGNEEARIAIREALDDKDEMVRLFAAYDLIKLGEESLAFPVLVDIIKNSKDKFLKESALGGLVRIGDEKAISVIKCALNDEDDYVRRSALRYLEVLGKKLKKY